MPDQNADDPSMISTQPETDTFVQMWTAGNLDEPPMPLRKGADVRFDLGDGAELAVTVRRGVLHVRAVSGDAIAVHPEAANAIKITSVGDPPK